MAFPSNRSFSIATTGRPTLWTLTTEMACEDIERQSSSRAAISILRGDCVTRLERLTQLDNLVGHLQRWIVSYGKDVIDVIDMQKKGLKEIGEYASQRRTGSFDEALRAQIDDYGSLARYLLDQYRVHKKEGRWANFMQMTHCLKDSVSGNQSEWTTTLTSMAMPAMIKEHSLRDNEEIRMHYLKRGYSIINHLAHLWRMLRLEYSCRLPDGIITANILDTDMRPEAVHDSGGLATATRHLIALGNYDGQLACIYAMLRDFGRRASAYVAATHTLLHNVEADDLRADMKSVRSLKLQLRFEEIRSPR